MKSLNPFLNGTLECTFYINTCILRLQMKMLRKFMNFSKKTSPEAHLQSKAAVLNGTDTAALYEVFPTAAVNVAVPPLSNTTATSTMVTAARPASVALLTLFAFGFADAIRTLRDGPMIDAEGKEYKTAALGFDTESQISETQFNEGSTISVQCTEVSIIIAVKADFFQNGLLLSLSQAFTEQSVSTCAAGDSEYLFEAGLQDCGSQVTTSKDSVIYSNKLIILLVARQHGIKRTTHAVVPVSCHYKRIFFVTSSSRLTLLPFRDRTKFDGSHSQQPPLSLPAVYSTGAFSLKLMTVSLMEAFNFQVILLVGLCVSSSFAFPPTRYTQDASFQSLANTSRSEIVQQKSKAEEPQQVNTIRVTCHPDSLEIVIKADMFAVGAPVDADEIRLGVETNNQYCRATASSADEYSISVGLVECGTRHWVTEDSLIYTNLLIYSPEASPYGVVRMDEAVIPIECHYERKYSVSSSSLMPTWIPFMSTQAAVEMLQFNLRIMTSDWQYKRSSNVFHLGEPISIEASVRIGHHMGLRVFVSSCVATLSPDMNSSPRHAFIENGCFVDSQLPGSRSQFLARTQDDKLHMSIDAFRFYNEDRGELYITCHLNAEPINDADATNKACTFVNGRQVRSSLKYVNYTQKQGIGAECFIIHQMEQTHSKPSSPSKFRPRGFVKPEEREPLWRSGLKTSTGFRHDDGWVTELKCIVLVCVSVGTSGQSGSDDGLPAKQKSRPIPAKERSSILDKISRSTMYGSQWRSGINRIRGKDCFLIHRRPKPASEQNKDEEDKSGTEKDEDAEEVPELLEKTSPEAHLQSKAAVLNGTDAAVLNGSDTAALDEGFPTAAVNVTVPPLSNTTATHNGDGSVALLTIFAFGFADAIRTLRDGPMIDAEGREYKTAALGFDTESQISETQFNEGSTISVQCTEVSIIIAHSQSSQCRPVAAGDSEYLFEAGLQDCGSKVTTSKDSVIYSNKLIILLVAGQHGIKRTTHAVVPVSCHYKRIFFVTSSSRLTLLPFRDRTKFDGSHSQQPPLSLPAVYSTGAFSLKLMTVSLMEAFNFQVILLVGLCVSSSFAFPPTRYTQDASFQSLANTSRSEIVQQQQQKSKAEEPQQVNTIRVTCHPDSLEIVIKADMFAVGAPVDADEIRLGVETNNQYCRATASSADEYSISVGLVECGTRHWVTEDSLIYTNLLIYSPEASPYGVVRMDEAVIPIECHYERKYSVSSSSLMPTWIPFMSTQAAVEMLQFNLRIMTSDWQYKRSSNVFHLGEPISIEASVRIGHHMGLRVFVSSCVATLSPDMNSSPRHAFIENGCFVDSQLPGSRSQFLARTQDDKLHMSIDAFRFYNEDRGELYITCHLNAEPINDADATNKACTFVNGRQVRSSLKYVKLHTKNKVLWRSADGNDYLCGQCKRSIEVEQTPSSPSKFRPRGFVKPEEREPLWRSGLKTSTGFRHDDGWVTELTCIVLVCVSVGTSGQSGSVDGLPAKQKSRPIPAKERSSILDQISRSTMYGSQWRSGINRVDQRKGLLPDSSSTQNQVDVLTLASEQNKDGEDKSGTEKVEGSGAERYRHSGLNGTDTAALDEVFPTAAVNVAVPPLSNTTATSPGNMALKERPMLLFLFPVTIRGEMFLLCCAENLFCDFFFSADFVTFPGQDKV
ncbi:hypothetical protein F7725_003533 [Dissostichus mawsoni]|uniref:Zona pellucida sperm-binding protein 3 n=1 Tax=Dissostichus mawsoni TaxID=36200 RepID=A0A7J5YAM0_DISMA|nr:hypothetical protein F7725_003533 [Dissostichus mawsoni]